MAIPRGKRAALVEHVREWYKRAKHDLDKAKDDLDRGWYPDSCFYAQQACEKILKAYLRTKGVIVRGHRIEELLLLAKRQGLDVNDLLINQHGLEELSNQYLAPRYPNFKGITSRKLEDYDREFAKSCLGIVMKVWSRVEDLLKPWISG